MENLLLTALAPHPPIMVPEVGGVECEKVESSINAMNELADHIVNLSPDTIVIVTPHSEFNPYKFSIYTDDLLSGNLAMFRAPSVSFSYQNDVEFISSLKQEYDFNELEEMSLDHGTMVPLYFINKSGYKGKLVVINYCALDKKEHMNFGMLLKKHMEKFSEQKFVFIASGDMSHRLKPTAPAGYHPNAYIFDEKIKDAIEHGDYDFIKNIPFDIRECAGECGYNSMMVALGLIENKPINNKVYSYEGPFGVGYLVATL